MTLAEIQEFVVAVDPYAGHYTSAYEGKNAFTIWQEIGPLPFKADGHSVGGIRFEIGRFSKSESDAIADAFEAALEEADDICYTRSTDYMRNPEYVCHIFTCEGI